VGFGDSKSLNIHFIVCVWRVSLLVTL
jgi:hypothetical protein